jgi:hypothetical protein
MFFFPFRTDYAKTNPFKDLELLLRWGIGSAENLPKQAKQQNMLKA